MLGNTLEYLRMDVYKAKVTAIKESKDLTPLSLDELIGNLKVHEMIIKKDSEIVKAKGERKSLTLKAKKESSDEESLTSRNEDEEYAMVIRDFKRRDAETRIILSKNVRKPPRDKNQRVFVGGSWSDNDEEDDEKSKDETCLMAQASSKITVLTTNTPYPSRKIRRIRACTHERPQRKQDPIHRIQKRQYAVFKLYGNKILWKISNMVPTPRNPQYAVSKTLDMPMDDPNITMEEYIRLEEENAQKRRKVFNWETTKYGKIWYDEDVHDLRSIENEFPDIVFNDSLTSNETLSCEPTVSFLNNNEIDFRISFDKSDDEDYTVVFDKNSISYKIICTNDLKTDSENDNEKVNKPLFPSPEPTVSCIDDLDFFKEFENEFPAIVYNDALKSKSDFSTEPTLCPQHIDEFDLKDETSLSEYDEMEQGVLFFNDLFSYNIIYPDDQKSDKRQ
ncbi:hypothetical protein Tco_0824871 [Tanacetum coccineum]